MTRSTDEVSLQRTAAVSVIRFEDPERRNALSIAMLESFLQRLEEVSNDSQTMIVRLEGAGSAFCSGIDLEPGERYTQGFVVSSPGDETPAERRS